MQSAARFTTAVLIALAALTGHGAPARAAPPGAPIDCPQAKTPDEVTVCADCSLGRLDERMATYLKLLAGLVGMGTRGALYDEQEAWEKERMACKDDKACLRAAYDRRLARLQEVYDQIASRGPF